MIGEIHKQGIVTQEKDGLMSKEDKIKLDKLIFEEGSWTPVLENCTYTSNTTVGKYIKIGKCVTVWFHVRPNITGVTGNGDAIISGLPYQPTWPQGAGVLSVCMCADTNYIPWLMVSNEQGTTEKPGSLQLVNNSDGARLVNWKVTNVSCWITGTATYFID